MTDLTRIFACKTEAAASTEAGKWTGLGYHVAVAGPTDAVRLSNGDTAPVLWESGEAADWYLVVASKASIKLIAASNEASGTD